MKLRTKLALILLPSVLAAIVALGLWSVYTVRSNIERASHLYLEALLHSYVASTLAPLEGLLRDNGLADVAYFREAYQREAVADLRKLDIPPAAHLVVLNGAGAVLLMSDEEEPHEAAAWQPLIQRSRQADGDTLLGVFEPEPGHSVLYAATHFAPWGWTVILAMHESAVSTAEGDIREATILVAAACSAALLLLLFATLHRLVVRPVERLQRMAHAIGEGREDEVPAPAGGGELGELARSMARMGGAIRAQRERLAELNAGLERVVAERTVALSRSEARYRGLVENALQGLYVHRDFELRFANHPFAHMLGYDDPAALVGSSVLELYPPAMREEVRRNHARMLAGERLPVFERTLLRRDGGEVHVELHPARVEWDGQPCSLVSVLDVSDRKALEEQLRQAQKMEAIGTLAGGIAHDFNNLLMSIRGASELALLELGPAHPQAELLRQIDRTVDSGANLTRQLLGFARRGKYETAQTDLNALLETTVALFARTRRQLAIEADYAPALPPVAVDRAQIEQVLLNLFVNAWQAMPDGGTLHLGTARVSLAMGAPPTADLAPGDYVRVTVRDTGEGMSDEVRQRIFEPFFTTRAPGEGTGLGLASAYGIMRNHGGAITVESVPGQGSAFHLYLPAAGPAPASAVPPPAAAAEDMPAGPGAEAGVAGPVSGAGTVLVVDDERDVRTVVRSLLALSGYTVHTAGSGEEALAVLTAQRGAVDLVVMDMVMPGLSGYALFRELTALRPELRVLACSGYTISAEAEAILREGPHGFMQKPFSLDNLTAKVAALLAGKPDAGQAQS